MNIQYVVDESGTRIGVMMGMDEYRRLLDAQEELEDIKAFDDAKSSGEEAIPFDQALQEIEKDRA